MEKERRPEKHSWNLNDEKRRNRLKIKKASQWDTNNYNRELTEDALAHLELRTDTVEDKYFGVKKGKKFREEREEELEIKSKIEGRRADWYQLQVEQTAKSLQIEKERAAAKEQEELEKLARRQNEKHIINDRRNH